MTQGLPALVLLSMWKHDAQDPVWRAAKLLLRTRAGWGHYRAPTLTGRLLIACALIRISIWLREALDILLPHDPLRLGSLLNLLQRQSLILSE